MIILSLALISACIFGIIRVDEKAKSTAAFLNGQTLFEYEGDSVIVFNNEIKIPLRKDAR